MWETKSMRTHASTPRAVVVRECVCVRYRVRFVVRGLCDDSYWVCLCASACVCEDVHKVVMNALRRVSV